MKKIVKILIIITLIFGAGIFLGIKVGFIPTQKERFFYSKLGSAANSGNQGAPLKELTNFNWDYVCSKSSYNPNEDSGHADFYFHDLLVARIQTREIDLSSDVDNKAYFNFGEYIGQKSDKKKYGKCRDYESSYDSEIKVNFLQADYGFSIKFLY